MIAIGLLLIALGLVSEFVIPDGSSGFVLRGTGSSLALAAVGGLLVAIGLVRKAGNTQQRSGMARLRVGSPGERICPNCGAKIPPDRKRFCEACGEAFDDSAFG